MSTHVVFPGHEVCLEALDAGIALAAPVAVVLLELHHADRR